MVKRGLIQLYNGGKKETNFASNRFFNLNYSEILDLKNPTLFEPKAY